MCHFIYRKTCFQTLMWASASFFATKGCCRSVTLNVGTATCLAYFEWLLLWERQKALVCYSLVSSFIRIPRKWSLCYCSVFIVDFEQILHIGVSVVGFEKVNASCSYAKGRLDLLLPLGIFFEGPEFHFLEELHKHVSTNCFYCYKENF